MLDKWLLVELAANCRQSYQTLARKLELSVNGVKKRVNRLLESGVIARFTVQLCNVRFGITPLGVTLTTDGTEDKEVLIRQLGDTQLLSHVVTLIDGRYVSVAYLSRVEELFELERRLRGIEHITQVETYQFKGMAGAILPSGYKPCVPAKLGESLSFTKLQKQVLRCLFDDPRMPIAEIAQRSKLTPKRVRTVLKELHADGKIHFSIRWVLGAGEDFDCTIIITYDPDQGEPHEIIEWFKERYPLEHWFSSLKQDLPEVWNKLVVSDLRSIEEIADAVKKLPIVKSVETIIYHAMRIFPSPDETRLHQILDLPSK